MKKKIAIFGGSFNPPHKGHRMVMELVRDSLPWDEIWLMPSGQRADKQMQVANDDRIRMAEAVAKRLQKEGGPEIQVSRMEIDSPVPTRTIDTFRALESLHPDHEFHFIMSSEIIPDIRGYWHEGEELFSRGRYVIIERPGSHRVGDIDLPPLSSVIQPLNEIPEISSTVIRSINTFEELRRWVDEEIAEYIKSNQIYGFKKA